VLIDLIGVPLDLGAGRRGVDMGPSAIRYAGLERELEALGHTVTDTGNVEVTLPEIGAVGDPRLRYLDPIVEALGQLAGRVDASLAAGRVPVVLGGDHSLALGSISGAAHGREIGVLWIDAHGDFNTPATSPSGNIHGMPLAALCGVGDEQLVGRGAVRGGQAHVGGELEVERRGHRDEHRRHPLARADVPADLHQPDRVGVHAAAQGDVPDAGRGGGRTHPANRTGAVSHR